MNLGAYLGRIAAAAIVTSIMLVVHFAPPATAVINLGPNPAASIVPDPNPYPYVGSLHRPGKTADCTATLIHPKWVLTARHCAEEMRPDWSVRLNSRNYADRGAVEVKLDKAFAPPISKRGFFTDIALIRLDQPVTTIPFATLARREQSKLWKVGSHAFFVGWGWIDTAGTRSQELRYASLRVSRSAGTDLVAGRNHAFGAVADFSKQKTAPPSGIPWKSDSGGPLFALSDGRPLVIGVESGPWGYGANCHLRRLRKCEHAFTAAGRPAVKQWIDDTIAQSSSILDGDFEAPIVSGGSQQLDAPASVGAWRVTAGSVDLVREDYWQAYHGAQSLDLSGCSRGRISQTIAVEPGRQYTVKFAYSGNPVGDRGMKPFHLEINGSPVGQPFSFDTTTNTRTDMGWKQGQLGFSSSGAYIELAFASDVDGCYGPALDDVKVEPFTI